MPKTVAVQNSFSSGEIDGDELSERRDVKYFYSACAYAENVVFLPQGGWTRRPGLKHVARVRAAMAAVAVTSGQVTAPNGGTIANLIDADAATLFTAANGSGNFTAFSIDHGSAFALVAVDLTDFLATTRASNALLVETSLNGSDWIAFGLPVDLRTDKRTRRFAVEPGAAQMARYVRVRTTSGTIVSLSFGGISLWTEGAAATSARLFRHTFSRDQAYMMVVADGSADVYLAGVWKAAIAVPHQSVHLAEMTTAQARDTMLLFHADVRTHRLFRQGNHHEWDSRPAPFVNIPIEDFGGVYTNGVYEVQELDFEGVGTNDLFTITCEGETTEAIQFDNDTPATTADRIKAALEALPNVAPGLTVTSHYAPWQTYRVEFTGEPPRDWQLMAGRMTSGNGFLTIRTVTKGQKAGEEMMSAAQGWPRCGAFVQQRLLLAGFRAMPSTMLVSLLAAPYDFDPEILTADGAFTVAADSDDSNIIHRIHVGRHLLVFTSSGEWWSADRKISKTEPFSLINATTAGIAPGVPVVATEGVVLYAASEEAASGSQSLQEFAYTELEQNYGTQPFSLLAAHLTEGVIDMAMMKPSRRLKTNLLAIVNLDGSARLCTIALSQQIRGMARLVTQGHMRAVAVDGANVCHFIVQRQAAEGQRLFVELLDWDRLLDASVSGSRPSSSAPIAGIGHLDAISSVAWLDGDFADELTPAGGSLTPAGDVAAYEIGRRFDHRVDLLAYLHALPNGALVESTYRVSRVVLELTETVGIAVSANAGPHRPVPLRQLGEGLLDVPLLEAAFSGRKRIDGLRGFARKGLVSLMSPVPGPCTCKSVLYDVSFG